MGKEPFLAATCVCICDGEFEDDVSGVGMVAINSVGKGRGRREEGRCLLTSSQI